MRTEGEGEAWRRAGTTVSRHPPEKKRRRDFYCVASLHLKCIVCVLYLGTAQAEEAVIVKRWWLLLCEEEGRAVIFFLEKGKKIRVFANLAGSLAPEVD